jgi:hypothetical protein
MTLVPQTPGGPGISQIDWSAAGTEPGQRPSYGNGNGNGAKPGPFDPRGAVQIPNNFWGFVMLMMGLKS